MKASQRRGISAGNVASGLVAIILSVLAVLLVNRSGSFPATYLEILRTHLTVGNVSLAAALAVLWQLCGSFLGIDGEEDSWHAIGRLVARSFVLTLFLGACVAAFDRNSSSLRIMLAFFCSAVVCDLVRVSLASRFTGRLNRVIIVGSDRLGAKAWREFRTHRSHGMELAGFVDQRSSQELLPDFAARYLGNIESLPRQVLEQNIDDVIVAIPVGPEDFGVQRAISLAGALGARILCVKDMCGIRPDNIGRDYGDTFFELVPAPRLEGPFHWMKRASDIIIAVFVLSMLSPLLGALAVCPFVRGRRLRFHTEQKIGFRRKQYRIYRLCSDSNGTGLPTWLSHLPLMWNVVRGNMSLVGPAPLSRDELYLSGLDMLAGRFNLRPGITGSLAPESADRTSSIDADALYIGAPSFGADMRSLARTFRTLSRRARVAETTAGAI